MAYVYSNRERFGNGGDYLIHYGVPGQKKGVRRYQNEDGSLTEEGKQHYGVGEGPGQQPQAAPKMSHREKVANMSVREKVKRQNDMIYKSARNRGAGRVSAFVQSRTPIGLISSAWRARKKREATIARKRAERMGNA